MKLLYMIVFIPPQARAQPGALGLESPGVWQKTKTKNRRGRERGKRRGGKNQFYIVDPPLIFERESIEVVGF